MPNWSEILTEIQELSGKGVQNALDVVRRGHIKKLAEYTKRNTIVYYSGFLSLDLNTRGLAIGDEGHLVAGDARLEEVARSIRLEGTHQARPDLAGLVAVAHPVRGDAPPIRGSLFGDGDAPVVAGEGPEVGIGRGRGLGGQRGAQKGQQQECRAHRCGGQG